MKYILLALMVALAGCSGKSEKQMRDDGAIKMFESKNNFDYWTCSGDLNNYSCSASGNLLSQFNELKFKYEALVDALGFEYKPAEISKSRYVKK